MAEMVDVNEEQSEIEAVEQDIAKREPEKQVAQEESLDDILPSKFKGKSAKELAKIVADQDSMIGRQAQEVGEVRKLADELLRSSLTKKPEETKPQEVDFFENPQEAIRQAVANSPDVLQAKQYAMQAQQEQARQMLASKHPDFGQVVKDGEFIEWIKSSKTRIKLFNEAESYDVDAADELLSTFKQLKAIKQAQVSQAVNETEKTAREKALKSASVDTSGTGESGKTVYRRAKLLEMQLRRPDEYRALADSGELAQAYLEGRVR